MKFDSGNVLQTSRRPGVRDRSVDEREDLEAQLRAARNQATNQGVSANLLHNQADPYNGPVSGGQTPPPPGSRSDDRLNPTNDVDEAHLENAARQRALELMSQGTIDLDAVRNNIRERSQNAIGESLGDLRARSAAMGFLDSGVHMGMEGTLRREGAIAEEEAVLQAERDARAENLRNIIAGAGISQGERGLAANLDDKARRNQLIQDILNGGEGIAPEDNVADLDNDGYVNAGEGITDFVLNLLRFGGARQDTIDNTREGWS
jgi:hypothetical protein